MRGGSSSEQPDDGLARRSWRDPAPVGLTNDHLKRVEARWRRRRIVVSCLAVLGAAVLLSGVLAGLAQWRLNRELSRSGVFVPARVYESSYEGDGLNVEFRFEGRLYRKTVPSGIFRELRGQEQGAMVGILVDPSNPENVRLPDYAVYSDSVRFRLASLPFVPVLLLGSRSSFQVVARLRNACWYEGSFEVHKTERHWTSRLPSSYHATLWNPSGAVLVTSNKMQGTFRDGRARSAAYFAPMGKSVLVLQHGDNEGVLITGRHPLRLTQQQPVEPLD